MQSFRSGAALAAAVFSVSFSVNAAEDRNDAVVVTAARVEQPVSEVIGAVSVITRKDIEQRGVHSVQDLLRGETGLSVANTGGLGKLSNVFLRGADAEQLLVLVDGVRVGSASSGTTPFEYLPVDQIERVEIIRGPRSSLYGSDAIGGVIQIFTRRGTGPAFNVGVGSHETSSVSASFGAAGERSWLSVAANRIATEGYNSCAGAPFPDGGGCFTNEPDRDGYENASGTLRAGHRWSAGEIEATALYASGRNEYDGTFANETDFVERVVTLHGRLNATERWSISALAGVSNDDQDNFLDDPASTDGRVLASRFETERRNVSLQSDFVLSATHAFTVGVDYYDDRVDGTTEFEARSRDNLGAFAQYQAALGAHRLLASARYDDNEQFGSYETGSLAWKWMLDEHWSLSAAWGTAFGAPTFNDLYFPGFSNPELDPETSRSYEVGIGWTSTPVQIAFTAYERHVDDLIVYDASIFAPNNLNTARIRGAELDVDASLGPWRMSLGYSGIDPRNRTRGDDFDNFLPRRSRHAGHFELGRTFGALDARARVTTEGSRFDDVANTHRLGSFAILDLVVDYALNDAWSVQGKLGNVFDRDYRTVRLYNQDGRTFFVSLRYRPS